MPTLYLMLGYPGAGKTTTAHFLHELTGAVHLWADRIRRERYGTPKYTPDENHELYEHLNELAAELLATGQSVIYDTNFNFYKDRERMRDIATSHNATAVVVWVTTTKELAKKRATEDAHKQHTRILGNMPHEAFERLSDNLQFPRDTEHVIELEGTRITKNYVKEKLEL